jgi:hypothetical protein
VGKGAVMLAIATVFPTAGKGTAAGAIGKAVKQVNTMLDEQPDLI